LKRQKNIYKKLVTTEFLLAQYGEQLDSDL